MLSTNLLDLYTSQMDFQEMLGNTVPEDNPSLCSHHILGLMTEAGEIAQADQRWKLNGRNTHYDRENKKEEIADAFIFLLNIAMYSNIRPIELYEAIDNKIEKNKERLNK